MDSEQDNVFLPEAFTRKAHQDNTELIGKFKGSDKFPKEFTILVNRIKDQIAMDCQFTKIILNMDQSVLQSVKELLRKYYPEMDESYLEITPTEIDPLI